MFGISFPLSILSIASGTLNMSIYIYTLNYGVQFDTANKSTFQMFRSTLNDRVDYW